MPTLPARYLPWLALLLILSASAALYAPWIDNPLVFDDIPIMKSPRLGDYAIRPFSLEPRQFPYFTLGFEQVISNGNLHVSRYVTLILHGLNGFLLFTLGRRLLARFTEPSEAFIIALGIGLLFVSHPVAVYGAGYIVQRTIIFATLFLLLSAIQYDKALEKKSWGRALIAGLCYGAAAMSKEHAVTGLICVLGLSILRCPYPEKSAWQVLNGFIAVSFPVATWIVFTKFGILGTAYEPDVVGIISSDGFPEAASQLGNWALSAAFQCVFFFRYLASWLWPNPAAMSIDIRPDLLDLSQGPWIFIGPAAFATLVAAAIFILLSRKLNSHLRLASYGLLWCSSLFFVELSAVRFQEPVVLYRSYLWAAGFLLIMASVVSAIKIRHPITRLPQAGIASKAILFSIAIAISAPIARERLSLFSSESGLWDEAEQKLSKPGLPGSSRIKYNRGMFLLKEGALDKALEEFEWIISHDPNFVYAYWGRADIMLAKGDLNGAISELSQVIKLHPNQRDLGMTYFKLALALRKSGRIEESQSAFAEAEARGMPHTKFELLK